MVWSSSFVDNRDRNFQNKNLWYCNIVTYVKLLKCATWQAGGLSTWDLRSSFGTSNLAPFTQFLSSQEMYLVTFILLQKKTFWQPTEISCSTCNRWLECFLLVFIDHYRTLHLKVSFLKSFTALPFIHFFQCCWNISLKAFAKFD